MKYDLYRTLGVENTASDGEIKRAFRILALKLHPDRNQEVRETEERFKEVNYAYSILGNPERRRRYDIYCKLFPPDILDEEHSLAHEHIFEKLFLNQDLGAYVDQLYKAVEYPLSLWKEWLSHLQIVYAMGLKIRSTWWLSLPSLSLKFAGATGRFLSERLAKRIGKDFSLSKRKSHSTNPGRYRQPGDIEMQLPLSKKELYEGTSLQVSFIRDEQWVRLRVRVPPGLQPGIRLRFKQKGNTIAGQGSRGDLYLKIAINH